MNTSGEVAVRAVHEKGYIVVRMRSGVEIRFPVSANKRLAHASARKLNHIEISPFGLHWPDLDEDLSFRGLIAGDYGQHAGGRAKSRARPPVNNDAASVSEEQGSS
jgi:hypothetical protein